MPRGQIVGIVVWTECFLATILIIARTYTNIAIVKKLNPDFWWACSTYVIAVTATALLAVTIHYGLGKHEIYLTAEQIKQNQLFEWIFVTANLLAVTLGRTTVISFLLKIESPISRRRWILYGIGALNVMVNLNALPVIWTQCTPTAKIWDFDVPGTCNGRDVEEKVGYVQGSVGAAIDMALAIYPMVVFYSMNLRKHVKIGLSVLFGFGVFASASSVAKTFMLVNVMATSDLTYELATLSLFAATEMWIILIVSCVAPLRPLFLIIFKSYLAPLGPSRRSSSMHVPKTSVEVYSGRPSNATSDTVVGAHTFAYAERPHLSRLTSDDTIFGFAHGIVTGNGIMLTTKVEVLYDEESAISGSERTLCDDDETGNESRVCHKKDSIGSMKCDQLIGRAYFFLPSCVSAIWFLYV